MVWEKKNAVAVEPNVNSGNESEDKDNKSKAMVLHWNFGLKHVDLCLLDFEDIISLVF